MSVLLWPFRVLWMLVTSVLGFTGRLIIVVLGLVLMTIGAFLTVTIVGAGIGIPLMALGFLLLIRGVF